MNCSFFLIYENWIILMLYKKEILNKVINLWGKVMIREK